MLHLSSDSSDHAPIQLHLVLDHRPRPKPFRFIEAWTCDLRCKTIVSEAWFGVDSKVRVASVRYKIHSTILALKKWNQEVFGFCHNEVKELERTIR